MLKIEAYKDKILEAHNRLIDDEIFKDANFKMTNAILEIAGEYENRVFHGAREIFLWLLEEYKEPILTDEEKEYLSAVIKPFRNRVRAIEKCIAQTDIEIIIIKADSYTNSCYDETILPTFERNTMFKNMELGKEYTPEELGL